MERIIAALSNAKWFANLGAYVPTEGQIAIRSLRGWDSTGSAPNVELDEERIARCMDWLPSSRDQADPIHGAALQQTRRSQGQQNELAEVYKLALRSLRTVPDNAIRSGPHDFTQAAKGSALYCVRMAGLERQNGNEGFWMQSLMIYCEGNWPCGLLPDKTLVVF